MIIKSTAEFVRYHAGLLRDVDKAILRALLVEHNKMVEELAGSTAFGDDTGQLRRGLRAAKAPKIAEIDGSKLKVNTEVDVEYAVQVNARTRYADEVFIRREQRADPSIDKAIEGVLRNA